MTDATTLPTFPLADIIGLLAEHLNSGDRPVLLFLGAGCSVSSGIPTAGQLVWERWLPRLRHRRQNTWSKETLETWATETLSQDLKHEQDRTEAANSITKETAGRFYGGVLELLYPQPERRQLEIEAIIDGKDPGFGYGVLAHIMTDPNLGRSLNTILTTNFDDLVTDALMIHKRQKARVITHHSLAKFIRGTRRKPQIIKLHGDARFDPRNTGTETSALAEEFRQRVQALFPEATLVFLGYGGADASIHTLMKDIPGAPSGGIWWVNDAAPPDGFQAVLKDKGGHWVQHRDFDTFMTLLAGALAPLKLAPVDHFKNVRDRFQEGLLNMQKDKGANPATPPNLAFQDASDRVAEKFGTAWRLMIQATRIETTAPDKADELFQKAIAEAPTDASILGNYALFLSKTRQDPDRAEEMYRRAIDADPNRANTLANYALFLTGIRPAPKTAEEMYRRAIDADPNNPMILGNYAGFLTGIRPDPKTAEEMYRRAIDADPNNAHILGNYAGFLSTIRKNPDAAEEMYQRAIDADPNNPIILGDLGGFLLTQGRLTEGMEFVQRAEAVLTHQPLPPLDAELAFYRLAHGPEETRPRALERLKELLSAGVRSPGFFLADNVARAREDRHPDVALLEALAAVLTGKAPLETLKAFPAWRESPPHPN